MKNRIKVIRAEQELTQEALAKKAGISRTTLSQIENDECDPTCDTVVKLVRALNTPATNIFSEFGVVEKQLKQ